MKPEELDRLFRDELEKLDHVPGLDWKDDGAWNKLNNHLKGGWNNVWTWTLSAIAVIVGGYLLYPAFDSNTFPVQKKENSSEKTVTITMDSVSTAVEIKTAPVITKTYKAKSPKASVKPADTITVSIADTSLSPQPEKIAEVKPEITFNRNRLMKVPQVKPEFTFQMPHMSLSRLKVNNSFNVSNLVKSIQAEQKAGQNFYYFYEYDKSFVPPAYGNTHQRFTIGNNPIITNFNK